MSRKINKDTFFTHEAMITANMPLTLKFFGTPVLIQLVIYFIKK